MEVGGIVSLTKRLVTSVVSGLFSGTTFTCINFEKTETRMFFIHRYGVRPESTMFYSSVRSVGSCVLSVPLC